MGKLIPDQLKDLWQSVEKGQITYGEFAQDQERLIDRYRRRWGLALALDGHEDLQESIVAELALCLGQHDLTRVRHRCTSALADIKGEWEGKVDQCDRGSVEQFYNESQPMIYELMWWHTLCDDTSPLAYVAALHFAEQRKCRSCLDFGCGVGSGGILFGTNGMSVTMADISSTMLDFSRRRFAIRGIDASFVDLKTEVLPKETFDMVTAMDVFEHLVDPVGAIEQIAQAIIPGGYLFGRFHAELDEDRPHHIVLNFGPTLECLEGKGFKEVWRDDWLWGHQVFQKG